MVVKDTQLAIAADMGVANRMVSKNTSYAFLMQSSPPRTL